MDRKCYISTNLSIMTDKIVQEYRAYISNLPKRIKNSSIKTNAIIEKTGIPRATFYNKLKGNSFSIDEVEQISQILAIEDYIDAQIAQGKADIKAGRIVDAKEALDRLREKLK